MVCIARCPKSQHPISVTHTFKIRSSDAKSSNAALKISHIPYRSPMFDPFPCTLVTSDTTGELFQCSVPCHQSCQCGYQAIFLRIARLTSVRVFDCSSVRVIYEHVPQAIFKELQTMLMRWLASNLHTELDCWHHRNHCL